MFNRTTQYAIRAMVAVARHDGSGYVTAKNVGKSLDIPRSFLAKVLQRLTAAGLLVSLRGPTGGVALARPADSIRLAEIVEAIDGKSPFEACLFGWPGCAPANPCPLHREWGPALTLLDELLRTSSLARAADLASAHEPGAGHIAVPGEGSHSL